MRPLIAGFIALVLISTIEQKPVTDPPRTITERVVVGTPPGEVASLQAQLQEALTANAQLKKQAENFNTQIADYRARIDARDRALVLKQTTPQVRPARQVPPATVYRTLPVAGGGKWVDVPVYGPLGRQRGTRREWQSNQVQYRANCAGGVCR
jgi:hypothetical protein